MIVSLRVARAVSRSETPDPGLRRNLVRASGIARVPDENWASWNVRKVAALSTKV